MPTVSVVAPTAPIKADAVVIGLRSGADGPELLPGAEQVSAALGDRLPAALRTLGARGRAEEITRIATLGLADFPLLVAVGTGSGEPSSEAVRRAVGAAVRGLTGHRRVHLALDADPGALTEGALLGSYAFTDYKSGASKQALRTVTFPAATSARAAVRRATTVADAVALTRDLVNIPANDLYPQTFAERAATLAREQGLDVQVLDERALKRGGYGGILGVGAGSARPPRLVRISYRPAKARTHLALVGKGITFDTGGLNLKTQHLTWMKSDMGGAAAVVACMIAFAKLKLPLRATATVPMAENMLSGSSYRPSDILTMYDGTTVEVADTDAEGRLILADAISRAMEDDPDRLIEISTLTGGQLVALGMRTMGAMGTDEWRDEVARAADSAGEGAWAMPLPEELRRGLDSPVADLKNLPDDRWGSMLVAGRFLGEFVPEDVPWVHLDIAGPSFNPSGPFGYTPKGGTGSGVRTIIAAAEALAGR